VWVDCLFYVGVLVWLFGEFYVVVGDLWVGCVGVVVVGGLLW